MLALQHPQELVELLRSHLAHLADLLLKDEVVARLADPLVVDPEHSLEGGRAVAQDVLVDLLGPGLARVGVDGLHVLPGPPAEGQEGHCISSGVRLRGAIQFCSTFSWNKNYLNRKTPFEFLLMVRQSMPFLICFSSSSLRWYSCRCRCAWLSLQECRADKTEVQPQRLLVRISILIILQCLPRIIIFDLMDKSHSSEQSNFFLISSESSRSDRRKGKDYAKFVGRIRELVELEGGDLEELYQRVENIVKKYLQEHRVVDFKEMYDSLLGIRNNSKRMREIVAELERRMGGAREREGEKERSVKSDYFETTSTTQKETKNSMQQTKEDQRQSLFDQTDVVNTSSKRNHVFKPVLKGRESHHQEMTPKVQRSNQSEHTPSPLRQSPSKASEEYLSRNREYESKVKQMMRELQEIKAKIKQPSVQRQSLKIDLKENEEKREPSEEEKAREMNSKIMEASQSNNSNPSPSQSHIQSRNSQPQQPQALPKEPQIAIDNPKSSSLLDIMKNTESISKQIEQLKEVASRLSINSNSSKAEVAESDTSIIPADKINQLIKKVSENKKNQPLLEEIENTTSQMELSDGMIPSFKNLADQTSIKYEILPGAKQVTSKDQISHQNDTQPAHLGSLSSSQVVTSFYPNEQKGQGPATVKYIYNPYPQTNYPNQSLFLKPHEYRPVPVFQPTNPIPIQRIYIDQNPKPLQSPYIKIAPSMASRPSPLLALSPSANNSSTSIMHPHLFNKSALQPSSDPRQVLLPNPSLKASTSPPSRKGLNLTFSSEKRL